MDKIEQSGHSALHARTDIDVIVANALGPDRGLDYLKYRIDWKRGAEGQWAFPLHLDFELNGSCNMRCPMCTYALPETKNQTKSSWMSLDRFREIIADAVPRGLKAIGLNGVNEPLLRPDLHEFVRTAKDLGVLDIMFHTNGMLLTDKVSKQLIEAGLTKLFVSIDAATQKTYDSIRVGGNLETVRKNIHHFLDRRRASPLPVLGVCFVRMKVNQHELDDFIAEWSPLVDFFAIQEYMNPEPDQLEDLSTPDHEPPTTFRCPQPFQRMRVSWNGSVRPCCSFYGDQMSVGQSSTPLHQIWTSAKMQSIRDLHREGRWQDHAVCRACVSHSYTSEVEWTPFP